MVPPPPSAPALPEEIGRLRERMQQMQGGPARVPLPTHPALSGMVQLHAGSVYEVDCPSLALALMAGPSRAGSWCAVVGVGDFGAEAAAEVGVELTRTVLVPEPGEQWLEVTAALVDVAPLVVLRPPGRVAAGTAERLVARLRHRSAALVTLGPWPRSDVRLSAARATWSGVGQGEGSLRTRRLAVEVRRGAAPPRRGELWFPGRDSALARCEPVAAVSGRDARHQGVA